MIDSSNTCEQALLYPFRTAEKYPFITLETAIKGSPIAIKYKGIDDTIDFNQFTEMILENIKTRELLPKPNSKANKRQLLTAFKPSKKLPFENCSETIQVQARLKPEVAIVIANIYTDMTKLNTPTASDPILLETYKLNTIPILFMIRAVIVRIAPLMKKIFVLFKISPYFHKYVFESLNMLYGAAAFLSLCQGRNDTKNAHKAIGNSILINFIISIIFQEKDESLGNYYLNL